MVHIQWQNHQPSTPAAPSTGYCALVAMGYHVLHKLLVLMQPLLPVTQVTYKRLQETLQQLSGPGTDSRAEQLPGFALVDVLFGSQEPRFAAKPTAWKALNGQLDAPQRAAVERALKAQDISLIHGPPGDMLWL